MAQFGYGLGLLGEPTNERRVLCVERGQDFYGDVPVEVRVVTPEYGGHPTTAQLLYDRGTAQDYFRLVLRPLRANSRNDV